LFCAVFW